MNPNLNIDFIQHRSKLKFAKQGKNLMVWDRIRKNNIQLTPEELVRQCVILHLIDESKFSANLIQVERSIKVGEMSRRFDIVVYDKATKPYLLVECKRLSEPINDAVFEQITQYNRSLKAPYGLVTNGRISYCYSIDFASGSYQFLEELVCAR